jgi:hypothetical protein
MSKDLMESEELKRSESKGLEGLKESWGASMPYWSRVTSYTDRNRRPKYSRPHSPHAASR